MVYWIFFLIYSPPLSSIVLNIKFQISCLLSKEVRFFSNISIKVFVEFIFSCSFISFISKSNPIILEFDASIFLIFLYSILFFVTLAISLKAGFNINFSKSKNLSYESVRFKIAFNLEIEISKERLSDILNFKRLYKIMAYSFCRNSNVSKSFFWK